MGDRTNVLCNRIFTIPDNMENELVVYHLNERNIVKTPLGNNFELYLKDVLKILSSRNYEQSYQALLLDADVKQMIFDTI